MRAVLTLSSMLLLLVVLWDATERPLAEVWAQASTRSDSVSVLVGSRGHMLPRAKLDGSDEYFEDAICVGDLLLKKPAMEVGLCLALLGPGLDLLSFESFDVAASSEQVQLLIERVGAAPKDTLLVASVNGFVQASADELKALDELLRQGPWEQVASQAIERNGKAFVVGDLDEACEMANRIAPEHLELAVGDPEAILGKVRHAGAIFLGSHSAETLGDYVAGPNHVLPTSGTARFFSPLGVYDFIKRSSILRISTQGLQGLGPKAAHLARMEGLHAHAEAMDIRMKK